MARSLFESGLRLTLVVTYLALLGCAGVRHTGKPYVLAGQTYPIDVKVSVKPGETVSGTVYYRISGKTEFLPNPLIVRGGGKWLSANLPVEMSRPGQLIEYYIDIAKGNESHALYSPASPKRVKVLSIEDLVARQLHVEISYRHDGDPVEFFLHTGGLDVAYALLIYQTPGLPGWTTVDMRPTRTGPWCVKIPGEHAHAGWWNYRIEVVAEGIEHSIPDNRWESFEVTYPPVVNLKPY